MAPRDGDRPGWVELPTIGDDGTDELPYAALDPGDIKEPIIRKPRRSRRPSTPSRPDGRWASSSPSVAWWPSPRSRGPSASRRSTLALAERARSDHDDDRGSAPGVPRRAPGPTAGSTSHRPTARSTSSSRPSRRCSRRNGQGTAFLVADLGGGARAELLWAPIDVGQPRTLAPFLAMTGAMERYPGIQGSPMRTMGGTSVIDGTRTTAQDRLATRVTETAHFAFLVLLVDPASVGPAAHVGDVVADRRVALRHPVSVVGSLRDGASRAATTLT